MKDASRRKFLNIIKFVPIIGAMPVLFPAFEFISSKANSSHKELIALSNLDFHINDTKYFFVINNGGVYTAMSKKCTHLGCTLKFDPLANKFICPCHKSEFSTDGKVIKGPATKDLALAKTKLIQNKLEISL